MRRVISVLPLLFTMLLLGGCLDGGSSGGDDLETGRLTIVGVEGLYYETSTRESGVTNSEGEFRYRPGDTISFWLGKSPAGLQLASNVPTQPFLTPLDFFESNRAELYAAPEDEYSLSNHRLVEDRLARTDPATINMTRLLLLLDDNNSTQLADGESERDNIRITDRVIQQFNDYLAQQEGTIDFTKATGLFAATEPASVVTRVIEQICFFPAADLECQQPHPQSEIEAAEEKVTNTAPNTPEREAAENERDRLKDENNQIENAVRYLDNIDLDKVESFLLRQTSEINSQMARNYYITPFEFTIPASDTSIKTVTVRSYEEDFTLSELQAITTNPGAVALNGWSWQTREVDFFVTGEPGSEGEVRIAFQPEGDYRWYQMQVRPLIVE